MVTPPAPTEPTPRTARSPRLASVDAVRGLVMVLMALDHVRDYFSNYPGDPGDPGSSPVSMFLTRWITHFCAPTFVFLAGTGAFLHGQSGKSKSELAWFLGTRGLWLVFLEFTLVAFGWRFHWGGGMLVGQVIWAIGVSMILLAALVHLPRRILAAFALLLIVGHNALDGLEFPSGDWRQGPWSILHQPRPVALPGGMRFFPLYPLVPWIGVMAVGYLFGAVMSRPAAERRRWCLRAGLVALGAFGVLRAGNFYGDPSRWASQESAIRSILSFLDVSKYPPSLLFLLMTLGAMALALVFFEDRSLPSDTLAVGETDVRRDGSGARSLRDRLREVLSVFGRVPLFYYLLHLYAIHLASAMVHAMTGRPEHAAWIFRHSFFDDGKPGEFGFSLWGVYLAWGGIVLALYPACLAYGKLKKRSKNPLFGYL